MPKDENAGGRPLIERDLRVVVENLEKRLRYLEAAVRSLERREQDRREAEQAKAEAEEEGEP